MGIRTYLNQLILSFKNKDCFNVQNDIFTFKKGKKE